MQDYIKMSRKEIIKNNTTPNRGQIAETWHGQPIYVGDVITHCGYIGGGMCRFTFYKIKNPEIFLQKFQLELERISQSSIQKSYYDEEENLVHII